MLAVCAAVAGILAEGLVPDESSLLGSEYRRDPNWHDVDIDITSVDFNKVVT
jgi:hypothetical protein